MKRLTRALTFVSLTSALVACGGGAKKSNRACDAGVNRAACTLDVREVSAWGETIRTYQSDPQTRAPIPGSERLINVAYEFVPGAPARWRRTITVDGQALNLAMFQEGPVESIGPNLLTLRVERSSCDGDASVERIYYRRSGGSLEIDTQPLAPPTKNKFLIDGLFADIVGKAIGTLLRQTLETAFTFGSLRTYLTANHGALGARSTDVRALANARYVCFNGLGPGYVDSKLLPSW